MADFPIIAKLGGAQAVFDRLKERKLVRTMDALRMWRAPARGVIPGDAARELMRWADEQGVPYTAADFALSDEAAPATCTFALQRATAGP